MRIVIELFLSCVLCCYCYWLGYQEGVRETESHHRPNGICNDPTTPLEDW